MTSFNGSFALWAKDDADFSIQLNLDDRRNLSTRYFANVAVIDSNSNPYARDPGYIIYRSDPVVDIPKVWHELVSQEKSQWQRNALK